MTTSPRSLQRSVTALMAACALASCATSGNHTAAGSMPAVGETAPDFSLVSNEGSIVTLDALRGRWVVLYFYPKNFTGGCTLEAQNFQRDLAMYEALDATIVGISVDSASSHREFCAKEGLTFKLLADTAGSVSSTYGSLNVRGSSRMSARNTFVIDPDGVVAAVFTAVSPATHSEAVLATLEKLRSR